MSVNNYFFRSHGHMVFYYTFMKKYMNFENETEYIHTHGTIISLNKYMEENYVKGRKQNHNRGKPYRQHIF